MKKWHNTAIYCFLLALISCVAMADTTKKWEFLNDNLYNLSDENTIAISQ